MIKKVNIILLILISNYVFSQSTNSHEILWTSYFSIESNHVGYDFIRNSTKGALITTQMKNDLINNEYENTIIGLDLTNRFERILNINQHQFSFSISDRNMSNTKIKKDFLRLILKGNNEYQDETLNFSKTNFRLERFQQFKIKYDLKLKDLKITSGLSFIRGNHHLSYLINNGKLYTAPFGSSIDLDYDIKAFFTDTSNLSLFKNNGNGFAFDLGFGFMLNNKKIHVSLEDLGYINWNTSSNTFFTDSSFNFRGIEIDDIFNFNDSLIQENNLTDDIPSSKNKSFKSFMPATINICMQSSLENLYFKKYSLGLIIRWQPLNENLNFNNFTRGIKESNYTPLIYIESELKTKEVKILPKISYGGYTQNLNLHLSAAYGDTHQIILGSNNINQIFFNENQNAFSIFITLSTKI